MQVPSLKESSEIMRHHWDGRRYPTLAYVETTNFCNARCTYCLYDRMERPVEYMSNGDFEKVVAKVKQRGIKIGAMFCFGEPLSDKQLFTKIRYARAEGALTPYLGLNTNCTFLTQEKYDDILDTCSNMTLSFVNVGNAFERMTRLSWDVCYGNAVAFIKYRDKHRPAFKIEIGCNDVAGHDRAAVKAAFAGYNVSWARDAELRWSSKVLTGPLDRTIMYPNWRCDGFKGAIQIKPNGDCCFCAYDVIRSESRFANIYDDSWDVIERNFKAMWREPLSICMRCDFWWNYPQIEMGGLSRGPHVDDSWQGDYLHDNARGKLGGDVIHSQHLNDLDLIATIRTRIKLGDNVSVHYIDRPHEKPFSETLAEQERGTVHRTSDHMRRIARMCRAEIVSEHKNIMQLAGASL